MRSPNLIRSMQTLLFKWFSTSDSDQAIGELNVQGFINGVQEFDRNFVPVSAIWKLSATVQSQERHLGDFLRRDVAIVVGSDPETITKQNTLLKEWLRYTQIAHAVYLKDKLYYIGHGYLLDSKFKPLIMATYSIKEFQQNHLSRVFIHSPTLHIAPELLVDPYWRKLVPECMIPIALESKTRLSVLNFHVPKKYANVVQNIDVKVHDLSQFILTIKMPSLTANVSEELLAATRNLIELPAVTY